ncbi:MAG: hypothetical protein H0V09_10020 [Gemmatimonadetes bacterium]|nr:hypothetical protein [Gemmatimonadota bacterium]
MPLRLTRIQLALTLAAIALFVAAIAILLLPQRVPTLAAPPSGGRSTSGAPLVFEPPLYVAANTVESPLVERNPFDNSRKPPVRRHTPGTSVGDSAGAQSVAPPQFTLLGTVLVPGGRDIAVIQADPSTPGGVNYHVGEEPLPGWRLTRITREEVTVVGQGQRIDLRIQKPNPGEES